MDPAARPDAVVAVLVRGGRLLVIRRGPAALRSGYWTPPSGRVEPGESQAEALVREMREELGLVVHPRAKVWECDTDDGRFRLHWWLVDAEGAALAPDGGEVAEARWVVPAEFDQLAPTFAAHRTFVHEILPGVGLSPPD